MINTGRVGRMPPLPDTVKALLGIIAFAFYQATGSMTSGFRRKFQMKRFWCIDLTEEQSL
jgi:hypothetical protein